MLEKAGVAFQLGLGVIEGRLLGLHLGQRLLQLRLVLFRLNGEYQIALLDVRALLEVQGLEITFDPRLQLTVLTACMLPVKSR